MADIDNMSAEELTALRDALQADLDAARADAGTDSTFAPEPTVRDDEDQDDFQKSEVVPSIKLEGGAAIPTHDSDGVPLSVEQRFALLWRPVKP